MFQTGTFGYYKQATHRRTGDEPFFYFGVHCTGLGMAQKWSILDQKWPNITGLSMFQSGLGVQNGPASVFDRLRPFGTISDKK